MRSFRLSALLLLLLVYDSAAFIHQGMSLGCRALIAHYCKGDHCAEVSFEEQATSQKEMVALNVSHLLNITCADGFQLLLTEDNNDYPNVTYEQKHLLCKNISTEDCGDYCEFDLINEKKNVTFVRDQSKLECLNRQWGKKDTIIAATISGIFLIIAIASCVSYFYLRARANRPPPIATTPPVQQTSK